jgi:hypothetical protein
MLRTKNGPSAERALGRVSALLSLIPVMKRRGVKSMENDENGDDFRVWTTSPTTMESSL